MESEDAGSLVHDGVCVPSQQGKVLFKVHAETSNNLCLRRNLLPKIFEFLILLAFKVFVHFFHREQVFLHHFALDHVFVKCFHQFFFALDQILSHSSLIEEFYFNMLDSAFAFSNSTFKTQEFHIHGRQGFALFLISFAHVLP